MAVSAAALMALLPHSRAADTAATIAPALDIALLAWAGSRAVSYEEFLALGQAAGACEWVNGSVVALGYADALHRATAAFLERTLRSYVERAALGVVRGTPCLVRLAESGRAPDLMFIAASRLERLRATHVHGAPDVIAEIISPASAACDRGAKFYEYEQAGVREYWLIDPQRQWAEFYTMDRLGRYQPAVVGDSGLFRSRAVRGFALQLDWLWELPILDQAEHDLAAHS